MVTRRREELVQRPRAGRGWASVLIGEGPGAIGNESATEWHKGVLGQWEGGEG